MSFLNNLLSFFRTVLAVVVGMFIFSGFAALFFFIFLGIALSSFTSSSTYTYKDGNFSIESSKEDLKRSKKSVLHLKLGQLSEESEDIDVDDVEAVLEALFSEKEESSSPIPPGVLGVAYAIRKAAEDQKIEGISMELDNLRTGLAQLKELYSALRIFKKSGKFIYAYSEYLSEGNYYLSSFADTMMMNPSSDVEFNGFIIKRVFIRGTLDMIGIKPRTFRRGKYKSAAETFTEKSMSKASRAQYNSLLNSIYTQYLQDLAETRAIPEDSLRDLAATLAILDEEDAQKHNFITHIGYKSEYDQLLRERLKLKDKEKVQLMSVKRYKRRIKPQKNDNTIAVIIAEGTITNSDEKEEATENISPGNLIPIIEKAANHKKIKAIVLRINSPGGSAYGSDKIWYAIQEARKKKPVIASMSQTAASGGYYLAMGCDKIVAYPNTITGSIGVISLIPEPKGLMNKIGITEDQVKSAPYADINTLGAELSEAQVRILQQGVDKIYQDFLEKAASGRDMSTEEVQKVAQGRVWTGEQALAHKLIDATASSFEQALQFAAEEAGIDSYQVRYLQTKRDKARLIAQLLRKLHISITWQQLLLPQELLQTSKKLQEVSDNPLSIKHIQAILPYKLEIR